MTDFQNVNYYQPPLIKLTQIGQPNVAGGQPTECYVDPTLIMLVTSNYGGWNAPTTATEADKEQFIHAHREHTGIWLRSGGCVCVEESPAFVHMLRERALGREVNLGVVS